MDWIFLNEKNDNTVNCTEIRSFKWVEKKEYEHGALIIRFASTGAYLYDVPKEAYEEMKRRAYNPKNYDESPFTWFDDNMISYHTEEKVEQDGHLYVEKYQI